MSESNLDTIGTRRTRETVPFSWCPIGRESGRHDLARHQHHPELIDPCGTSEGNRFGLDAVAWETAEVTGRTMGRSDARRDANVRREVLAELEQGPRVQW
jgi:hypothetical protein